MCSAALAACGGTTTPSKPAPAARTDAAATFDEKRQQLVVFGGVDSAGHALGDMWAYDAHGWHQLAASAPRPSPRAGAAFAFNPDENEDVLFGGHDGAKHYDDTWIWNGRSWSKGVPLDAPEHDVRAAALVLDRTRVQLVLVVCCTSGAGAKALGYTGNGHHWSQQNSATTGDPPVPPETTWMSGAYDYTTGRVMVVSTGDPGQPPVNATFNGFSNRWEKLAPLGDLPAGARPRLLEDPDGDGLLALLDGEPGGPAVYGWNGVRWATLGDDKARGLPGHVAATAVDIHDAQGLVLGSTPSVLAWRDAQLQAPTLGGKAHPLPLFGQPTSSPTPLQAVKAARAYAPTPAELPVRGFDYSAKYGRGEPLPSEDRDNASDTWEVVFDGPGNKRIVVDVWVMDSSSEAFDLAHDLGTPGSDVPDATDKNSFVLSGDVFADTYRTPVANSNLEFWAVTWSDGRIAFQISDRAVKGVLTVDDALAVARAVDAKARS